VVASTDNVTLLPPSGEWVFTANAPAHRTRVYIDLAWDARWDAGVPTGIDMDLDVVEQADRGVWIDDRDEWEEHRVKYGYPLDVVDRLEAVTLDLEARVSRREAPFDDATIDRWLGRMTQLHGSFDAEAPPADH
jgi:protein associated with RNAse G/E